MDVKVWWTVLVILSLFCVTNSSVLSGLAGFGFRALEHDVCDSKTSDQRTCYETQTINVSCFTAEVRLDSCKTHAGSFHSNDTFAGDKPRNWTYLQAYYHRLDGGRHRQGIVGTCVELSQGNCTQSRCLKKCCVGWEMDGSGQCNKPSPSLCKNGGTYDWRRNLCMCTQGFSGQHCEIALCHRGCLHDGLCVPTSTGNNVCLCPRHVSGSHCQYLNCPKCENGGHCISDGPLPTCKCPNGFYGKTCSHSYQGDTECPPPNTTICTDLDCTDDCAADDDCQSGKVCCTDGCCMKCIKPKPPGCWYNGVLHEPFSRFRKDNCTECVCHMNGSTECFKFPVSSFDCQENKTQTHQGRQFAHRLPTINCSHDTKAVPVDRDSDRAYMENLNIRANTHNGSPLKVNYSPVFAVHDRNPVFVRNAIVIKAYTQDTWGRTAVCYQRVIVVDRTPPRFLSCPSDIYATDSIQVTWREPRASDNVGISYLNSNYKPSRLFPTGRSMVVYTAGDYDDNKAFCTFYIHVTGSTKPDTTPPKFLSCPSTVYGTEGEPVVWTEPRAIDSGGIRSLVSTRNSNSLFPPGLTEVVYTATDYAYNVAHCKFNVYITPKDTTPPKFLSCPSTVYGTKEEPVVWTEPRAIDSGGIRSLVSTRNSNSLFPPGLTKVVYTATDYAYNVAHCKFNVYITPKATVQDYPEASSSRMTDAMKITVGIGTSLIVILVIIIVTVIVCKRRRLKQIDRSRSRRQVSEQVLIQTISNHMYEGMGEILNGTTVPTLKPPPYSPATEPPAYDEVFSCSSTHNNPRNENLPDQPPEYDSVG